MRRLLSDIASNVFSLSTTIAERMVVTGLLIRHWGLDGFEFWSVATAATSLFAIFDGGSMMVFSNRMSSQLISGDRMNAIRTFRQSNSILFILASIGFVILLGMALSQSVQSILGIHPGPFQAQSPFVLLGLGSAVVLRLALSNLTGVYRAHRQFGRSMQLVTIGELARVAVIAILAASGAGLAWTAIAYAACTLGSMIQIWVLDVRRRWPDFRFSLEWPRDGILAGTIGQVWFYGLPFLPSLALAQGPVLVLGGAASLGSGVVGSFVLLRTVANLVRVSVSKVINVLALKVSDVGEEESARVTAALHPLRRLTSLLLGIMAGGTLYYGRPLFHLWAGKDGLFDLSTLFVMLLPMLFTPTYLFALGILQYRGRPLVWTIGTFVQVAIAGVVYFATPGLAVSLRLAFAVFGSEVLAIALPVLWATHGRSVRTALRIEAPYTIMALLTAAGVGALGVLIEQLISSATMHGLAAHILIQGLVSFALLGRLTQIEFRRLSARRETA